MNAIAKSTNAALTVEVEAGTLLAKIVTAVLLICGAMATITGLLSSSILVTILGSLIVAFGAFTLVGTLIYYGIGE